MNTTKENEETILGLIQEHGVTAREDATSDLVMRATRGDRRALGAIATTFGLLLVEEARAALNGSGGAEDVVQDFFVCILEQKAQFTPDDGPGVAWLCRTVRQMALRQRKGPSPARATRSAHEKRPTAALPWATRMARRIMESTERTPIRSSLPSTPSADPTPPLPRAEKP
jgi:DNA-directed RNA polymerase specialized sigma24 family protein